MGSMPAALQHTRGKRGKIAARHNSPADLLISTFTVIVLSKKPSSERYKCAHHAPLNGSLNAALTNLAKLVLVYAVSVAYIPSASTFGHPLPSTFIVLLSVSLVHGPVMSRTVWFEYLTDLRRTRPDADTIEFSTIFS
ncbi:uncharacterized protein HD556DRAFT_819734 [Suillus plorans]|uniref:Uncharacterized protein n=1 Tax=Suillus plorans TaxID=116603 RepID=A0A9P7AH94_9AGAM|nr:uncharacterized protein HD556DRAFT_819734 [Suillus plorans]KAG1789300.1 hypothetical protein HD556DRAFT_819734 [Suillus plorans]